MPLRDSRHPDLTEPQLMGEGINSLITHLPFWPHKDMEGLPGWGISSIPGPSPRKHKHERRYIPPFHPFIIIRRIWKNAYDGQMLFVDVVGLKLPDICLRGWGKTPKKPHPGNLSRPGIELGPAAWQARMLPPAPQRWTNIQAHDYIISLYTDIISTPLCELRSSEQWRIQYTIELDLFEFWVCCVFFSEFNRYELRINGNKVPRMSIYYAVKISSLQIITNS